MSNTKQDFLSALQKRGFQQDLVNIKLCRESYVGGTDYINASNLFTHCRERKEEFIDRLKRAYYLNYSAPIIDTYTFFIFKSAVTRTFNKSSLRLSMFIENCDRKGTSLDEFMKKIAIDLLTAGRSWVVLDVPQIETLTLLEEYEANKRPYLYSIKTENILDYEEDDEGLVWVKFVEERSTKNGSWFYEGSGLQKVTVIWSRGHYEAYDEDGNMLDNIDLAIDFVPIVKLEFNGGRSLISDISRVNRSLFNWCSLLDEGIYRQTFSWLIIPADKSEPLAEKRVGTSWAFTFDPEAKHTPQFISPDTSQLGAIETRCEKAIAEIYRIANLDWANSQQAAKSGIAKGYDFMNVNKALAAIAYTLQEGEKRIFSFINRYLGEPIDTQDGRLIGKNDIIIQYPSEFSYTAVSEKLSNLYTGISVEWSKHFRVLCAKDVVTSNFPSLAEKQKEEIFKEIEEYFDNQEQQMQEQEDNFEGYTEDNSIENAEDVQDNTSLEDYRDDPRWDEE